MAKDVRAAFRSLFDQSPPVPVRLDFRDGQSVVIDSPRQVSFQNDGFTVTVGEGRPAVFFASDLAKATPLDELPPQPGRIGYGEFYAAIRPLLWAEPFTPFEIEFYTGKRLRIESAGRLALAGRIGVYRSGDRRGLIPFTYEHVSRIIRPEPVSVG